MEKKYKYHAVCNETQARQIVNCLNEKGMMIRDFCISPKDFDLNILSTNNLYRTIGSSEPFSKENDPEGKNLEFYIKFLEGAVKISEKEKVMPLTTMIIDRWGDTKIENMSLIGMNGYDDNEDILKIYGHLTDLSKMLNGWRFYRIRGDSIEQKRGITKVKRLISNLSEEYSLDAFMIYSNPWIRSADHYCDYLECDGKFYYHNGKIEITSETEINIPKIAKKLPLKNLQLEPAEA